jgi:hypothetical protein
MAKDKQRVSDYNRAYREKNKDRCKALWSEYYAKYKKVLAKSRKEQNREKRIEVVMRLGGRCVCCGITEIDFLAIDHIHGGGLKDLRERGIGNTEVAVRMDNFDRTKYQILCHNCNMAKGFIGYCPHERMRLVCGQ